jgi:4-amino-4-deoxy-L-arabinose transferase-like glycosyltransferase
MMDPYPEAPLAMTLNLNAKFMLLLLLTLGLRLYGINHPLTDLQNWRQTDTAAIARSFATEEMNILHPRVDWRGSTPGFVESEFPLYPYLVACLYEVWGRPETSLGRLVSVVFAVLTVAMIFLLGRSLWDPLTGWIGAFVYAVAPLSLYYTRTFMPESMMMFFFMAALLAFYHWIQKPTWRLWGLACLAAALAISLKPTAMLLFFPVLGMLYDRDRFAFLRDYRVWLIFPAVLIGPAAWYVYAYTLYQDTGLTFGILGGGYSKFQIFSLWKNFGEIGGILTHRFFNTLLTPVGASLFLLGLGLSFLKPEVYGRRGFLYAWLGSFALYLLVVLEGNRLLEYYQIFLIPVAGLIAARALVHVGEALFPAAPRSRGFLYLGVCTVLLGTGLINVANHYESMPYARQAYRFGQAAETFSHPQDLFLVVDNNLRYNPGWYATMRPRISPPHLLFFLNRSGWVLLPHEMQDIGPKQIEHFMESGARYFVIPLPLLRNRPDLQAWLRDKQKELFADPENGLALYRLNPEEP